MNCDKKFESYNYGKIDDSNVNVSVNSVYCLLTKLCEKLLVSDKSNNNANKFLRKCRSKAFEILLSKKLPSVQGMYVCPNNILFCGIILSV